LQRWRTYGLPTPVTVTLCLGNETGRDRPIRCHSRDRTRPAGCTQAATVPNHAATDTAGSDA